MNSGVSIPLSDIDDCEVGDKGADSSSGVWMVTDFFNDEVRLWIEGLRGAGLILAISSSILCQH